MIVGIDGTPAVRRIVTGTEVYARSIIEALAALRADRRMRVYANAREAPGWLPAGVEWRGLPFPRLWTHWRFRRALRDDRPEVAFIPSHVLPVGLDLPSVVTIHDVGHRREARAYTRAAWWYLEMTTRYAARHASALIAVSRSTADDLRHFYGVPDARVTVIHSGVDARMGPPGPARVAEVTTRLGLDQPYFLFVGRNRPRKNLPMLREAFAQARHRGLRASLALAGPGHDAAASGDGVQILPYVSADDLPALYAGAIGLTIPSRFEGFGFPALEAMRCGTAVIASAVGALPEVIGPAGVLLSPDDAQAWTQAMLELAADADRRRQLIEAGASRSAAFTWESTGRQTWSVLDRVAGRAHPATTAS